MKNNKGFLGLGLILAIIAVLVVGGGAYYLGTKNDSVPKSVENNLPIETQDQNNNPKLEVPTGPFRDETTYVPPTSLKEYKNTELGFSFISPYGIIKPYDGRSFIGKGEKGEDIRGYISNNPIFYFAGITSDYSAPRGVDCGEVKTLAGYQYAVSQYGEILNTKGVRYVYGNVTTDEMTGLHQIALFKLKKGQFSVLGFCALGMNESDFKNVINTVVIE